MNQIQLTKEQLGKIAGGAVLAGGFLYVYAFYFWIPTSKVIAANSKKNAAMEKDIAAAKAQKAAFPDLEAKLASLKEEKEEVQQRLPGAKQFPDVIKTVETLSAKHKVRVQSIAPSGSANTEYFIRTMYRITATGNYHDIGRFLAALGLEVRIMTVENLSLSGTPGSDAGTASAAFTLVTYQYNENTKPAPAAKPGSKKKKKK
ncbi:MAG TPA: type 4a pilus biogenesis protein PilO [Elusimicrobiales bacterium]|nr:type 4a pilus biogenesis protein PilO [Elusimicrobiales bacterium]